MWEYRFLLHNISGTVEDLIVGDAVPDGKVGQTQFKIRWFDNTMSSTFLKASTMDSLPRVMKYHHFDPDEQASSFKDSGTLECIAITNAVSISGRMRRLSRRGMRWICCRFGRDRPNCSLWASMEDGNSTEGMEHIDPLRWAYTFRYCIHIDA
jgi:hypothetical protein